MECPTEPPPVVGSMEAIQVIDRNAHVVTLPSGKALLVGAPPEALKVLVLWEHPFPSTVILPADPLFAHGVNQASIEFLLYNHLFLMNGLRDRVPFTIVCDPVQAPRIERMTHHMLRGPSAAEMTRWGAPADHQRQLLVEMDVVSGEVSKLDLGLMVRVLPFTEGGVELEDGVRLEAQPDNQVRITSEGKSVTVPRGPEGRASLPLYFAEVDSPVVGPQFGLQVIGSASGFSAAEWSSCFIIWINGQPLIIDGTPYLDDHLRRLGIEDDQILGYLITHTHEDHANMIGQLVGRRPVTVLTSGPVMAGLINRLSTILDLPDAEVERLIHWVPLDPGLEDFGQPLCWFGAEIRTWYSVHTIPTLGVDVSMDGRHIRMPGDTLWGRQLDPLLEQQVITRQRYEFIQHTYNGADVIVADAGGGPIHPDPNEVHELLEHGSRCQLMVTHVSEKARKYLPNAEPGTTVPLLPRKERTPEEAMAMFSSPVLRGTPEKWLSVLLFGGDVLIPQEDAPVIPPPDGALVVLSGSLSLRDAGEELFPLQRGDVLHRDLIPHATHLELFPTAQWTRLLHIPEGLYRAFLRDTNLEARLRTLFLTRSYWRPLVGSELGLDTLVTLSELCREKQFHAGDAIVRQGEPADHFYVVMEGQVEVIRENGKTRNLGSFGPGFAFGEIGLLENDLLRTATVRARRKTRVLEMPARAFERHLMGIPLARYHFARLVAKRKMELLAAGS